MATAYSRVAVMVGISRRQVFSCSTQTVLGGKDMRRVCKVEVAVALPELQILGQYSSTS